MLTFTLSQPFNIAESVRVSCSITRICTLIECDANLRRCLALPVGHLPLLSSFSACKSSLRLFPFHHVIFPPESQYGIANELSHSFLFSYG